MFWYCFGLVLYECEQNTQFQVLVSIPSPSIGALLAICVSKDSSYFGLTPSSPNLFCPQGAGCQQPPSRPGRSKERRSSPSGHAPHHPDQHLCDHLLPLACSLIHLFESSDVSAKSKMDMFRSACLNSP